MDLEGKIIRLACNQSSSVPTLDTLTAEPPVIWKGAIARLQCALFVDEPAEGTLIEDTSNLDDVQLVLRTRDAMGTVLLDKHTTDFTDIAWANWVDLSAEQFEFVLSEVETNQTVPASGVQRIYFSLKVTTGLGTYVVAIGYGTLVDVGITGVGAPVPPGAAVYYFSLITRYLGGLSTDLNAVPTVGVPSKTVFQVVIDGVFSSWRLEAGTAVSNLDFGIIRPLDYNSGSNPVNLVRVAGI